MAWYKNDDGELVFGSSLVSAKKVIDDTLNYGSYISTGNTARDAQALGNTAIQRAAIDAAAAGINPTYYLTNGGSITGSSAEAVLNSSYNKQALRIAQQNADSASKTADAAMISAYANAAKAVSNFIPK